MIVIGGLFVAEMLSDVIQIAVFRTTGRRVFRNGTVPPSFIELAGWAETHSDHQILADSGATAAMFGLGLFYSDWLGYGGRGLGT